MKLQQLLMGLVFSLAVLVLPVSSFAANSDAIKTMAGILKGLHHYPSAEEKKSLQAIVANDKSTAGEKVLATALINIKHTVSGADQDKLEKLMNDESATGLERSMADIIIHINHEPRPADQPKLDEMMK